MRWLNLDKPTRVIHESCCGAQLAEMLLLSRTVLASVPSTICCCRPEAATLVLDDTRDVVARSEITAVHIKEARHRASQL